MDQQEDEGEEEEGEEGEEPSDQEEAPASNTDDEEADDGGGDQSEPEESTEELSVTQSVEETSTQVATEHLSPRSVIRGILLDLESMEQSLPTGRNEGGKEGWKTWRGEGDLESQQERAMLRVTSRAVILGDGPISLVRSRLKYQG